MFSTITLETVALDGTVLAFWGPKPTLIHSQTFISYSCFFSLCMVLEKNVEQGNM